MKRLFVIVMLILLASTVFAADKTLRFTDAEGNSWTISTDKIAAIEVYPPKQHYTDPDGKNLRWLSYVQILFVSNKDPIEFYLPSDADGSSALRLLSQLEAKMNGK
jgi:hypothetical protein